MFHAIVLINVERRGVNHTAQALLKIPGVSEVYFVTGKYDLVAILCPPNVEDVAPIVTSRMVALPDITRTETLMAFKVYSREDLEQAWDIGVG